MDDSRWCRSGARRPDEDRSDGFEHGGWHMHYVDEAFQIWMVEGLTATSGFVLGRRTYESFAGHWPNASDEEQPIAEPLNRRPKYVASRTLRPPLEWQNSTLLDGDVAEPVQALKKEDGGDLRVIGSAGLVHTLIEHDLVDEFQFIIDPVLVGGGKRIFVEDGKLRRLTLVSSETTGAGSTIVTYARHGR